MDMARMQAVADKTRAFYETNTAGCALLKVKEIATQPQPALCLTDYNFPKDMRCYLDDRAARLLHAMALRDGLADDTLPALAPWYGIAERLPGRKGHFWRGHQLAGPGAGRRMRAFRPGYG